MVRRLSGEGSVFKRTRQHPDGTTYVRWVAQVTWGSHSERHAVRRVRRTRAEANAALAELLGPRQSRQRLGDFLRSWLDETAGPSLAPNTRRGYAAVIASARPLQDIPLGELTAEDVEGWLNRLRAQRHGQGEPTPASAKTRRNALAMLRRALDVALRRGYVTRNVADLVEMPRVTRIARDAMTPERARAVLAATAEDRYAAAYGLALCGLRAGEILGLSWEDVDLEAGTARIRRQLVGSGRTASLAPLKTRASEAPLALPAFAIERLRDHRTAQLAERIAAGQPTSDGLVFVTERGYAVNGSWLTKHFGQLLERAGMKPMRLHDLRHATATLLAAAGVHPRLMQEYLRHAQVNTTLRIYTHVARGQEREAAEALERVIVG